MTRLLVVDDSDAMRDGMVLTLDRLGYEVRNPLGAMALYAGALGQDLAGRPEEAHVARIQHELLGLGRLVEDFLDYARQRPPALEPVDGARLAEEVGQLCRPLAEARGVALLASGEGAFSADRHQLRRAALNLVRNAIEASPPGGAVELGVEAARGAAVLTVLDRGPGLPAEARARLVANPKAVLVDVREDSEWLAAHAAEARHLGKGILERDIENLFPDKHAEIIMYCGGGFRSALTCDVAQRMGFTNVASLIGGYKALVAADWPMKSGN